ncbi:hypothetical protein AB0M35_28565 [Micromonospora sp. NPDC051196]|uniref:hypothetical protein n=1 Tax=Micromonospora sp. NPDC051196 TaxID=3155281 RepID=UPI0034180885
MLRFTAPARRVAAALGSVLLAGCHTVPAIPANAPPTSTHSGQQPATPPATPPATAPGLTAQQRLATLAAALGPVPADRTTDLRFTYLHLQTWNRTSGAIRREDLRRWRHPDGSGREVTRRAPDVRGVAHQPRAEERDLFRQASPTTTRYRDELHPYLPAPLPTDPAALAELLAPPELAAEPAYPRLLAWGVVNLAVSQYLNLPERTTALHVLAAVPGIAYLGTATDLAGRAGAAFQVVADTSTVTLIIDPTSGELLAAQERITGPRPGLFSYVLILHRGHTDAEGVPPGASTPSTPPSRFSGRSTSTPRKLSANPGEPARQVGQRGG